MDKVASHPTAEILQFPANRTKAGRARHAMANCMQMPAGFEFASVSSGGCWYHEEAVVGTKPVRDR